MARGRARRALQRRGRAATRARDTGARATAGTLGRALPAGAADEPAERTGLIAPMHPRLADLADARVAIWGFGREGRAALAALRRYFPHKPLKVFCSEAEASSFAGAGAP